MVAKTWKKAEYFSIDNWIENIWYIYTMEYYSDIREDEILPFATTWMVLEDTLSKISQIEKVKDHTISLICVK